MKSSRNLGHVVLRERSITNLRLLKTSYAQGTQSPTHYHDNARLVFVLRGKFSETYCKGARECRSFTTIFRPPREEHSEDYYGKGVVCLSTDIHPAWLDALRQYNVSLNKSADFGGIALAALITKLNNEFDKTDDVSALAVQAVLLEIAVEISRRGKASLPRDRSPQWLFDAVNYIHAQLTSNLSISDVAAAANVR